jgi:hypothetical protein
MICAGKSSADRPGTNWPRISNRPRNAVRAPVGSFNNAKATGRAYDVDVPRMFRSDAAAETAAAMRPTTSTRSRSVGLVVCAMTASRSAFAASGDSAVGQTT